jgi:O-glycosyl hydrolase
LPLGPGATVTVSARRVNVLRRTDVRNSRETKVSSFVNESTRSRPHYYLQ